MEMMALRFCETPGEKNAFSCLFRSLVAAFVVIATPDVKHVVAADQHFAQIARQCAVDEFFSAGQLQRENQKPLVNE